uniref:Uncharacterized protein n=1 Tax=Echeneis naucrates TaxID=173247 RepID=A0A665W4K3_ECHNA
MSMKRHWLNMKSNRTCSLYLFSCTIQGNIFINYFLNTGFLVSIWRREFHRIPQFLIAINIALIVVTVTSQ